MRLNLFGGNMPIITPRDPQLPMEAANKNYVDNSIAAHAANTSLHITASQSALLDALTVTATEINQLSGITSNVQAQLDAKLNLSGGTMTGALTLSGAPTANLHAATKQYVDTQVGTRVAKSGELS